MSFYSEPFNLADPHAQQLLTIIESGFREKRDLKDFVESVGVDINNVDWERGIASIWPDALREVARAGKLRHLMVMVRDHPNYAKVRGEIRSLITKCDEQAESEAGTRRKSKEGRSGRAARRRAVERPTREYDVGTSVTGISVSPDKSWSLVCLENEAVILDLSSGGVIQRHSLPAPKGSRFMRWLELTRTMGAVSPDGTKVALSDGGTSVRVCGALDGRDEVVLAHDAPVTGIAFDPSDGRMAVSFSGGIRIWDPSTKEVVANFRCSTPMGLAFTRDGSFLATYSEPKITAWHSRTRVDQKGLLHFGGANSLAFGPDPSLLALAWNNGVLLCDPLSGKEKGSLLAGTDCRCVAFGCEGNILAVGTDTRVMMVDPTTADIATAPVRPGAVESLSFSADGTFLLAGGRDKVVQRFDI